MSEYRRSQTIGHRRRVITSGLIAAIGVAVVVVLAKPAEEITFCFAPPDGVTYVKMSKSTKVKTQGEATRTTVDALKMRGDIRKTTAGYVSKEEIVSVKTFIDGEQVALQFPASALVGFAGQIDLDDKGKVLGIRGRNDFFSRLKNDPNNTAPDDVLNTIVSATFGSMEAEWNANIAGLVGRTVKVGDSFTSSSEVMLPLGFASVSSNTRLVDKLSYKGKACVRIRVYYNVKDGVLILGQQKLLDDLSRNSGAPSLKVLASEIVGQEERIIDPSTMLVYSETFNRTSKVVIENPTTGKLTSSLKHQKEATYDYGE